jgi:tRNA G18 (ribose-2'-O)-methylase SpoU
MFVREITSLDLPVLEPYRTLRRTSEHRKRGIFVAEGEKVVRRLIESDLSVLSVLLTPEWLGVYFPLLEAREVEEGVFVAKKGLLETIVGYELHQGIMAIGKVPEQINVLKEASILFPPRLFVAVDGVANSENMGVIVRNCAAFGTQVLIAGETSCDPYLRRSVRNSMGAIFKLPVSKTAKLSDLLTELKRIVPMRIIAADPKIDSIEIKNVDLTTDICLVFGSEGEGISRNVIEQCDVRIKIPMCHDIDSINVASSVAVALYEVHRQRFSNGQ